MSIKKRMADIAKARKELARAQDALDRHSRKTRTEDAIYLRLNADVDRAYGAFKRAMRGR